MPDVTLDEADRCPHCGAMLRNPPNCCQEMIDEDAIQRQENRKKIEAIEEEFARKLGDA